MKTKHCIICNKSFKKAPPEHIIPKSIGGQYTIHSVCEKCNGSMNKSIDEPFKEHKLIATYRFIFETKGRSKKVPNPMSKETINIDGIDHKLKLTEDLSLEAKVKPEFPKISDIKLNETIQITLDEKDLHLLDSYIDKLAKKLGVSSDNIKIQSKSTSYRPEKKALFITDNNTVLLEFSKILYQTSCDLLGKDYINDPIAKKYARMLKAGEIDPLLIKELNPDTKITNEVFLQMIPNVHQLTHHHVIMISGYVGLGLVGFVKIFGTYHVQILSRNTDFSKKGAKFILNNFKNNSLGIYEPNKLPNCNVSIKREYVINEQGLELEFKSSPPDKEYPVLNKEGNKIAESLFELVDDFQYQRKISTNFRTDMDVTLFFNDSIYIKPKSINTALPIDSITFRYKVATLKNRN